MILFEGVRLTKQNSPSMLLEYHPITLCDTHYG
jgi:hypothetical protein